MWELCYDTFVMQNFMMTSVHFWCQFYLQDSGGVTHIEVCSETSKSEFILYSCLQFLLWIERRIIIALNVNNNKSVGQDSNSTVCLLVFPLCCVCFLFSLIVRHAEEVQVPHEIQSFLSVWGYLFCFQQNTNVPCI